MGLFTCYAAYPYEVMPQSTTAEEGDVGLASSNKRSRLSDAVCMMMNVSDGAHASLWCCMAETNHEIARPVQYIGVLLSVAGLTTMRGNKTGKDGYGKMGSSRTRIPSQLEKVTVRERLDQPCKSECTRPTAKGLYICL